MYTVSRMVIGLHGPQMPNIIYSNGRKNCTVQMQEITVQFIWRSNATYHKLQSHVAIVSYISPCIIIKNVTTCIVCTLQLV